MLTILKTLPETPLKLMNFKNIAYYKNIDLTLSMKNETKSFYKKNTYECTDPVFDSFFSPCCCAGSHWKNERSSIAL
jgi:hypothetical protein